ncbi:CbtB domain-containing protein [Patulibacter minatonensis]|uniref:CbtB domain-containing protein n=1 Tax=Patulibacter minatonensis TaxID=298163 RepID=UPI00047BF48C|nr:CbtB-domain containing protein [Patulibacter minatonensis]
MATPSSALDTTQPTTVPVPVVSLKGLLPYWIFAGIVLMLAIYFVGAEEGATSMISGMGVHEFVHDARHLLGFPCH